MLLSTFMIINQQHPKFCAIFFSKINRDAHVSIKMNAITYYNWGLGEIAPESLRNVKKMDAFPFNVMVWIQICARGVRG